MSRLPVKTPKGVPRIRFVRNQNRKKTPPIPPPRIKFTFKRCRRVRRKLKHQRYRTTGTKRVIDDPILVVTQVNLYDLTKNDLTLKFDTHDLPNGFSWPKAMNSSLRKLEQFQKNGNECFVTQVRPNHYNAFACIHSLSFFGYTIVHGALSRVIQEDLKKFVQSIRRLGTNDKEVQSITKLTDCPGIPTEVPRSNGEPSPKRTIEALDTILRKLEPMIDAIRTEVQSQLEKLFPDHQVTSLDGSSVFRCDWMRTCKYSHGTKWHRDDFLELSEYYWEDSRTRTCIFEDPNLESAFMMTAWVPLYLRSLVYGLYFRPGTTTEMHLPEVVVGDAILFAQSVFHGTPWKGVFDHATKIRQLYGLKRISVDIRFVLRKPKISGYRFGHLLCMVSDTVEGLDEVDVREIGERMESSYRRVERYPFRTNWACGIERKP